MGLTAVVTCHENQPGLDQILTNLAEQTVRPDEVLVYHSGIDGNDRWIAAGFFPLFETLRLTKCEDRRDWGHEKRSQGLAEASCEYIGFFNDDDSYHPRYVELMLRAIPGRVAVWCAWNERPDGCDFGAGSSTSGNYVANTERAQTAGYTDRHYEADGTFIGRLGQLGGTVEVPHVLYAHNVQPFPGEYLDLRDIRPSA